MSKLFLFIIICIAIFIGFRLYSKSAKQQTTETTSQIKSPLKGIERAQYLIKLSTFAGSIREDSLVYTLPAEDIIS